MGVKVSGCLGPSRLLLIGTYMFTGRTCNQIINKTFHHIQQKSNKITTLSTMASLSSNPMLPPNFLTTPAPDTLSAHRIDFAQTPLPQYKGLYAVTIDNVLNRTECQTLIRAAEASTLAGWERAMINIGGGLQRLMTEERNCGRIIWDSRDIVSKVWQRIERVPEVQEILRLEGKEAAKVFGNGPARWGEVWRFTRLNERMRFLKYGAGEYFRPHCDGSYETPDRRERSYFTLHLYLNDAVAEREGEEEDGREDLVGGATTFHAYNMRDKLDVMPVAGRVLLFQHRNLLHSGDDVVQGIKHTMRTDLMYTLESTESKERRSKMPVLDETKAGGGEDVETAKKARARFGL